MEIVWNHGGIGGLAANEVRRELARGGRRVARNTVRTLLERMEQKGWLTHVEEGRTFLYSPARPRSESIGHKVREVIDTICGGSPEALVTALLDYRGLRKDELQRIREMLDRAVADESQRRGGKGGAS
jgi:predicted transcriptional regulator